MSMIVVRPMYSKTAALLQRLEGYKQNHSPGQVEIPLDDFNQTMVLLEALLDRAQALEQKKG